MINLHTAPINLLSPEDIQYVIEDQQLDLTLGDFHNAREQKRDQIENLTLKQLSDQIQNIL